MPASQNDLTTFSVANTYITRSRIKNPENINGNKLHRIYIPGEHLLNHSFFGLNVETKELVEKQIEQVSKQIPPVPPFPDMRPFVKESVALSVDNDKLTLFPLIKKQVFIAEFFETLDRAWKCNVSLDRLLDGCRAKLTVSVWETRMPSQRSSGELNVSLHVDSVEVDSNDLFNNFNSYMENGKAIGPSVAQKHREFERKTGNVQVRHRR